MLKGYSLTFVATVIILVVLLAASIVYYLFWTPQTEEPPRRSRPVFQNIYSSDNYMHIFEGIDQDMQVKLNKN